ncbi:MAG: aminopeptidase [Bacilli bacterium]|jgi:aminopeptidase
MKKSTLKKYANLIAKTGANVQRNQDVIVYANIEIAYFVTYVVEACYKLGARSIKVEWSFEDVQKLHVKYESVETLGEVLSWQEEKFKYQTETLPVRIYLESSSPDSLKGINQEKLSKSQKLRYPIIKPYIDEMENKYQWVIAAVPGQEWATKVFPDLSKKQARMKLWDAILFASRADGFNPLRSWEEHNLNLANHARKLNLLELRKLYIRSQNGTDLEIGLIPDALFIAGGDQSLKGIYFNPNIPTEECFTTPMRGKAEGIVYASKPLSFRGELIENFYLRFENGKVVEAHAEKNDDLLQILLNTDEGARYLGEVALVPKESPINQLNMLFYNTLFDENAACHIALGRGFTNCIIDYNRYTLEQLQEKGVNDSMIHIDIMIGTDDMQIEGETKHGQLVTIFRNGTWA